MRQSKYEFLCFECPIISGCNEADPRCLYRKHKRAKGVEKRMLNLTRGNPTQQGLAALGFRKYDKRRKPDNTQRTLWRIYKQAIITDS